MNKILIYLILLAFAVLDCSKKEDQKGLFNGDASKFVVENKSYYFHSVSTLYHMRIQTNDRGEVIDTTWNTESDLTYCIRFHQDTLFNDTLYKYVWYKTQNKNRKIGLIREAEDGKIYYRTNPYYPENLLYDFDLDVNETFNGNLVVKTIKVIENTNYKRKQLLLTQCCRPQDTLLWINGIGNTNNILSNKFDEECYCGEDGLDLVSTQIGSGKTNTDLLFVTLENAVIYKNPVYNENPDNFEFIENTEYY